MSPQGSDSSDVDSLNTLLGSTLVLARFAPQLQSSRRREIACVKRHGGTPVCQSHAPTAGVLERFLTPLKPQTSRESSPVLRSYKNLLTNNGPNGGSAVSRWLYPGGDRLSLATRSCNDSYLGRCESSLGDRNWLLFRGIPRLHGGQPGRLPPPHAPPWSSSRTPVLRKHGRIVNVPPGKRFPM